MEKVCSRSYFRSKLVNHNGENRPRKTAEKKLKHDQSKLDARKILKSEQKQQRKWSKSKTVNPFSIPAKSDVMGAGVEYWGFPEKKKIIKSIKKIAKSSSSKTSLK